MFSFKSVIFSAHRAVIIFKYSSTRQVLDQCLTKYSSLLMLVLDILILEISRYSKLIPDDGGSAKAKNLNCAFESTRKI